MAASLLAAVGLDELAVADAAAYEALAHELATNPSRLEDIRARLAQIRTSAPLFDTALSCRSVERAYALAHARLAACLPRAGFDIPKETEA